MLTPRNVPRLWREATSPGTGLCLIKERDKIMGVGGGGVRFWESKSLQPKPIPSLCANQPFGSPLSSCQAVSPSPAPATWGWQKHGWA